MPDADVRRWARFLVGGGVNTALTYAIYFILNTVISYQPAYLMAYVIGVVFSYWFNATVVFKTALSWKGFFAYPLVYVAQYVISALFLGVLVEYVGVDRRVAPLAVTAVMVPLTYVMSKLVLSFSGKRESGKN